jgi:actin-related protein
VEVNYLYKDGDIENWDVYEKIVDYSLNHSHCLSLKDLKEHPILLSCPVWSSLTTRQKHIEIMFETFRASHIYLARTPSLVAFSVGRPSVIVLDVGHQYSYVCPVVDGFCLTKNVERTRVSGEMFNHILKSFFERERIIIPPPGKKKGSNQNMEKEVFPSEKFFTTPISYNFTPSFIDYHSSTVFDEIKCSAIQMRGHPISITPESSVVGELSDSSPDFYELADGKIVNISEPSQIVSELLWNVKCIDITNYIDMRKFTEKSGSLLVADLPSMLCKSLTKAPLHATLRKDLWANLVVVGGTCGMKGFQARLVHEMELNAPPTALVKITMSRLEEERHYAAWVGGAILASLSSFKSEWVSAKEYADYGTNIINTRCLC